MVTGGSDGKTILSSTEIFTGGQWEAQTELPVKMFDHCQVTSNGGVIVAGEIIERNLIVLSCVLLKELTGITKNIFLFIDLKKDSGAR